jgi:hypothetical protein
LALVFDFQRNSCFLSVPEKQPHLVFILWCGCDKLDNGTVGKDFTRSLDDSFL